MKASKTFLNYAWWMQFEPHRWTSNPTIQMMTDREYRTYFQLLNFQWLEPTCTLPDNVAELSRLANVYPSCLKEDGRVMGMFARDNGRLFNRELLDARCESEEVSIRNSANGKKGGRPKKKAAPETQPITDTEPASAEEETRMEANNSNTNNNNQIENKKIGCVDPSRPRNPDPDPAQSPPPARHGSSVGPDPVNTGQGSGETEHISFVLERLDGG
jgi:hypothetical protein